MFLSFRGRCNFALSLPGFALDTKQGFAAMQGKVKWFNDQKGYGFIADESGKEYFVHHSAIEGKGFKTLQEGESVSFEVEQGSKGLQAVRVTKAGG
jgi:CspA family cold shock protein